MRTHPSSGEGGEIAQERRGHPAPLTAHDRVSRPVDHRGKEDNQTRKRGYAGPLAVGPARINERTDMARGQPITPIEIEHTLLMAKYDLAAYDIANILNRSQQSVYRILKRYGVAARPAARTEDQHLEADRLRRGVEPVIEPEPEWACLADHAEAYKQSMNDCHVEPQPEPEPVEPEPVELVNDYPVLFEFECKECGQEFHLTTDHIEWFEARGINVPKRCQPCRERRREMHDGGGLIGGVNLDELAALRRRLEDMERRLQ